MPLWKFQPTVSAHILRPVLFLDRDGVLNAERDYLADPANVDILPGVFQGLAVAREAGFWLVGVTNQSGLGRGYFQDKDFQAVMFRLHQLLEDAGVGLDAYFYCPHAPDDGCNCRKPRPGMILEAGEMLNLDLENSWVIGDKSCDVELGRDAGLGSVLVRTGHGARQEAAVIRNCGGDSLVRIEEDLCQAVEGIIRNPRTGEKN